MLPCCFFNQSIPRITSNPLDFNTAKLARNSTPLIRILTRGH
uniref:Uncharacterized protein n=1 Tax=Arundo donax TaxID=35708 RepID=A0A0A9BLI1_ARUDO